MEEYLEGFKFYAVVIIGLTFDITTLTIGTYRPKETVHDLFDGMNEADAATVDVWELTLDDLQDSKELLPIFCVELHTEYTDLEAMVKDLMVWRLSGMMDKEMKGIT